MRERDESGRFVSANKEEQKNELSYGFYSKLLNKPFDSLEQLQSAELEYRKANDEKLKAAEEKKARAKEVEEAYKNMLQVRKECNEKIREADKKYNDLVDAFVKDYKYYHMTYTDDGTRDKVYVSDLFDSLFNIFKF